ncbi:inorganic phosphate transporter [Actinomyces minihominis]|uniref:inorganic phosphate transporter n=1 Tax=Actinomyces minihominis TaxID=2002838 RepID=UPI00101AEC1B|nr:inorganic phosphate transporter [Actinomyces minihominis]
MSALLLCLAVAFVFLNGRNDGAALAAVPFQTARKPLLGQLLFLWIAIPIVPYFGLWTVAGSLQEMLDFGGVQAGAAAQLASITILFATLLTVGASIAARIPTSITLALVGALTGVGLADGSGIDTHLVLRVLALGLAAPIVSAALSFLLSHLPLPISSAKSPHAVLQLLHRIAFGAISLAYSANDGQKILFTIALVTAAPVSEASRNLPAGLLAAAVFAVGTVLGLRSSGRFVRHGITATSSVDLLWTEVSTAATVLGGAALGTPLSMTQSMTGGLLGVGVRRSRRAIYWNGILRVCIAWVWTLPISVLIAFLISSVLSAL